MRILLATDAASEGINLQAHCHRLLHWEIPWNPNRLEQRNGRIDRHGQHAPEVDVFHFVPAGWESASRQAAVRASRACGSVDDTAVPWRMSCTSSTWRRRRSTRSGRTLAARAR